MPGVQNPHCRPCSARNARCTGCISPELVASPSTVTTSRPSAWAASTVHDFTDCPSSRTVQAPQELDEQGAILHLRSDLAAVDGHADLHWLSLASLIAAQTLAGVVGMSMCLTPRWLTASMTAFCMAGAAPMVPASPIPLAPSGLAAGVSLASSSKLGSSAAVMKA